MKFAWHGKYVYRPKFPVEKCTNLDAKWFSIRLTLHTCTILSANRLKCSSFCVPFDFMVLFVDGTAFLHCSRSWFCCVSTVIVDSVVSTVCCWTVKPHIPHRIEKKADLISSHTKTNRLNLYKKNRCFYWLIKNHQNSSEKHKAEIDQFLNRDTQKKRGTHLTLRCSQTFYTRFCERANRLVDELVNNNRLTYNANNAVSHSTSHTLCSKW